MMATLPAVTVIDEAPGVIATAAQVDAWIETAKPGAVFVYVSGTSIPIRASGAKRMRELAAMGLVYLTQKRLEPGSPIVNYRAMRSEKPSALTKPERPTLSLAPSPVVEDETAIVDALLPILSQFARHGRPCPTDKQLATRADLTEDAVKAGLAAMSATHLIRVTGCAAPTYRRVLILATGAMTGFAK